LHRYKITIIFLGLLSLISIHLQTDLFEDVIAQQSLSTIIPIVNENSEEQNKSKTIKAFGHFANNQIKDGIVTWIQGGFWELKINTITNNNNNVSNVSNSNIFINNNNSKAEFIANFTMIKPDGSLSHNHDINNFVSSDVIITDKDIVVMGVADIYSDNNNNNTNEYKNVSLTIHLMGKKVLGLTIDVGKTKGHFSSPNEMFGTLISGVGLDTSTTDGPTNSMMHHDN
jgi:hypothetical protein